MGALDHAARAVVQVGRDVGDGVDAPGRHLGFLQNFERAVQVGDQIFGLELRHLGQDLGDAHHPRPGQVQDQLRARLLDIAEREQHHPDLHVAWGKVVVEVWTHKIKGLHRNDFIMAAKTDQLYGT